MIDQIGKKDQKISLKFPVHFLQFPECAQEYFWLARPF